MAVTRAASAVSIPGRVVKNDCGSGAEEAARGGCDDGFVCSGCRWPEGGSTVTAPLGCCAGGGRFQQAPGALKAVRSPPHLLVAAAVGGRQLERPIPLKIKK